MAQGCLSIYSCWCIELGSGYISAIPYPLHVINILPLPYVHPPSLCTIFLIVRVYCGHALNTSHIPNTPSMGFFSFFYFWYWEINLESVLVFNISMNMTRILLHMWGHNQLIYHDGSEWWRLGLHPRERTRQSIEEDWYDGFILRNYGNYDQVLWGWVYLMIMKPLLDCWISLLTTTLLWFPHKKVLHNGRW